MPEADFVDDTFRRVETAKTPRADAPASGRGCRCPDKLGLSSRRGASSVFLQPAHGASTP